METRILYKQLQTKGDPEGKRLAVSNENVAAAGCKDAYDDPRLPSVLALVENKLDELFQQW